MKKEQTIQRKLFIHYFVLLVGTVLIFLGLTLFFMLRSDLENAAKTIRQTANSIQNEVEMEMDKANNLQKRIFFSEQFKEVLFSEPEQYEDVMQSLQLYRELSAMSDMACGPDEYRNFQMNYWNSNGGCAGVGYNSYIRYSEEQKDMEEYQKVVVAKGGKVVSVPRQTEWAGIPTKVLSMYRLLEKKGTEDKVIIETQMNYDNICEIIEENMNMLGKGQAGYDVMIYNADGENIYVSERITENADAYMNMVSDYENGGVNSGKAVQTGIRKMFTGTYSEDLEWHIWVFEDFNVYMETIKETVFAFLMIGVLSILILWILTYMLTRQFVRPILEIHGKMKRIDLEHLDKIEQTEAGENIKELKELNETFHEMCLQLKDSKNKLQVAHENELQSRFLAMQAQMNPHFLYNILAIIKIMGKEAKSTPIVETCTQLSMMLRYISSNDHGEVTIGQEKRHLENYLKLMKTRFQSRFEYVIDIPENMENIRVPRLILQPLAENSVKYATEGRAPWKIEVRGWLDGKKWYISVRDNGPGIDKDKKKALEDQMSPEMIRKYSSSLEIGGMGIMNIYSRLVLLYGYDGVFELKNCSEGGLEVLIGGNTNEEI